MSGSQCSRCLWYLGALKCEAYKKGIPPEIVTNKKKHDKVNSDQKGDYLYVHKK